MRYPLDNPILSELRKAGTPRVDPHVLAWANAIDLDSTFISALTRLEQRQVFCVLKGGMGSRHNVCTTSIRRRSLRRIAREGCRWSVRRPVRHAAPARLTFRNRCAHCGNGATARCHSGHASPERFPGTGRDAAQSQACLTGFTARSVWQSHHYSCPFHPGGERRA